MSIKKSIGIILGGCMMMCACSAGKKVSHPLNLDNKSDENIRISAQNIDNIFLVAHNAKLRRRSAETRVIKN